MIILSYNSRGLGRGVKWAAIRRTIIKNKVNIACFQETKKESFNKGICQAIWGDSSSSWDYVPSIQASGGLLCLWNNSVFEVDTKVKGSNYLMLEGRCVDINQRMFVVNIYAPCDLAGKRLLWDELKQLRASKPPGIWCFMGDFNSIRNQDERYNLSQSRVDPSSISDFNTWISEMELQEIKCVGSTYTWIRPNARVKSRLDRFLVSEQWLLSWPDSSHLGF